VAGHSGDGEAALRPTQAWLTRYNLRPSVNAKCALFWQDEPHPSAWLAIGQNPASQNRRFARSRAYCFRFRTDAVTLPTQAQSRECAADLENGRLQRCHQSSARGMNWAEPPDWIRINMERLPACCASAISRYTSSGTRIS
jgi:hypothetical protein